jgi:hypothetical protein
MSGGNTPWWETINLDTARWAVYAFASSGKCFKSTCYDYTSQQTAQAHDYNEADFHQRLVSLGGHLARVWYNEYVGETEAWVFSDGFFSISVKRSGSASLVFWTVAASDKLLYASLCALGRGTESKLGNGINILTCDDNGRNMIQNLGTKTLNSVEYANYSASTISDFKYIETEMRKENPSGRIVILDGPPGTGKTFLVKGLIHSVQEAKFVIIPSNMVSSLASPRMSYLLVNAQKDSKMPIVLVIEDADSCLISRGSDNMSLVDSLLNIGDGLLGSSLDIRIICTTNARKTEIDPAILRPGRLCKHLTIGPLPENHASEIYRRLTGKNKTFSGNATLAEIYQAANTGKAPEKERQVGFGR